MCRLRPAAAPGPPYLYVLGEAVEHLFSHRHGLGEVPLALLLNDVLARVVPVEVADGLLWAGEAGVSDASPAMVPQPPRLRPPVLTCSRRR